MLTTIIILAAIVLVNIFFGYWRSNTRTLSVRWFLAVHLPVPIAIALRLSFLGWNWVLLPIFVGGYAAGQFAGTGIRKLLRRKRSLNLSSFLVRDLWALVATRTRTQGGLE